MYGRSRSPSQSFCEILATYPRLIYPRLPHNAGLKARADKNGRLFAALEGPLFHGNANRGEALTESPRRRELTAEKARRAEGYPRI